MNKIWSSSSINTSVKIKLLKSLITSIALYGCETWTYTKNLEGRINAFEFRCFRRILGITWKQKITNMEVKEKIVEQIGIYEPLLETARRRKLQWFGHVTRRTGTLAYDIMHGAVEGSRGRGRPKNSWMRDIVAWTERGAVTCVSLARDREGWRRIVESSKCPNGHRATGVT